MRLMHESFSKPLVLSQEHINVLVVENRKLFANMVQDLKAQSDGEQGKFVMSQDYTPIELSRHMEIIIDFFSLTGEQKRIQGKLNSHLKALALDVLQNETILVQSYINEYYSALAEASDYPVSFDASEDAAVLIKTGGFRIELENDSLTGRLIDYMTVCSELCGISCFTVVNLKCFLSDEELRQIYKLVRYKKLRLLLLENMQRSQINEYESTLIIDEDMCELTFED